MLPPGQSGQHRSQQTLTSQPGVDHTSRDTPGGGVFVADISTMKGVLDKRLVGYWSDKNLQIGSMEGADVAFRADGYGWVHWSNFGGGFFIMRFSWDVAEGARLTLAIYEELSGTWRREQHTSRYRVSRQEACDTKTVLTYEIRQGQDVLGRPALLLETGQPVSLGTVGSRFAFERELAGNEQDRVARRRGRR
jgi:hypothetical protein